MFSQQFTYDYFSVEELRTPPPSSYTAETDERSARRLHLVNDMRKNISSTKSGIIPRSKTTNSRVDELNVELSALRGKMLATESLLSKYRNTLRESIEKAVLMSKRISDDFEIFEVGLTSSKAENKTASREIKIALKEAALKVLTRHEKDVFEIAQMLDAEIASLHVLTDREDYSSDM